MERQPGVEKGVSGRNLGTAGITTENFWTFKEVKLFSMSPAPGFSLGTRERGCLWENPTPQSQQVWMKQHCVLTAANEPTQTFSLTQRGARHVSGSWDSVWEVCQLHAVPLILQDDRTSRRGLETKCGWEALRSSPLPRTPTSEGNLEKLPHKQRI